MKLDINVNANVTIINPQPVGRPTWVDDLLKEIKVMSVELNTLKAEVEENTTVVGSATVLMDTLADKIEQLKNNPAELQALVDKVRAQKTQLAESVAKNTLAEDEPTP